MAFDQIYIALLWFSLAFIISKYIYTSVTKDSFTFSLLWRLKFDAMFEIRNFSLEFDLGISMNKFHIHINIIINNHYQ